MVTSKHYEGTKVICEYDSSNLKKAVYNTDEKKLNITFGNGSTYEYDQVPHDIFAEMNVAESQGKFFNKKIAKNYSFRKL